MRDAQRPRFLQQGRQWWQGPIRDVYEMAGRTADDHQIWVVTIGGEQREITPKISTTNRKLDRMRSDSRIRALVGRIRAAQIASFSLLAGWTCPGARDCLARVVDTHGKRSIQDGAFSEYRCYAAAMQAMYKAMHDAHRDNMLLAMALAKADPTGQALADMLLDLIPPWIRVFRWHIAGDWFSLAYLRAAVLVAKARPDTLWYGYTKSLHLLAREYPTPEALGPNFGLVLSKGGAFDRMMPDLVAAGYPVAHVVMHADQQPDLGPVDHSDAEALLACVDPDHGRSFRLVIHGNQPAGSEAARAVARIRRESKAQAPA